MPWLVWTSGLSACLWTERSLVQFPVKEHIWVVGQVSIWGHEGDNPFMHYSHIDVSLPLSKIKCNLKKKRNHEEDMDIISDSNTKSSWPYWAEIAHLYVILSEFRMKTCRM